MTMPAMNVRTFDNATGDRYARCIEASRRIRWDIEEDVIRGRNFAFDRKFLPDSLSRVDRLLFLDAGEQRFLSQIQGRTYANLFGLVEHYINAKILELSQGYALTDQTALEALIRFSDEEIKHQALFHRIEAMVAEGMPPGYEVVADPNEVAQLVLGKSTWGVLALTLHIELFTQAHYRHSIEPCDASELYKDVFLFHWKEESQHAILDELEWRRENDRVTESERDQGVDDLIALVTAVDGILQAQAAADTEYFVANCGRTLNASQRSAVHDGVLDAYRWQYIVSGVEGTRFTEVLAELTTPAQLARVTEALAPLM